MSYRSNCGYESTSGSDFDPGSYSTNRRRRRGKSKRHGSYKTKGACRGDDGKFVSCDARPNAGGRKRKSTKKSSKRSWESSKGGHSKGYPKSYSTKGGHKKAGKKAWPKSGSRKMGHVVAGVEARVHEDVSKAVKILKSAKYRSQATAKRGGSRKAAGYSVLDKIVRELERLLTR